MLARRRCPRAYSADNGRNDVLCFGGEFRGLLLRLVRPHSRRRLKRDRGDRLITDQIGIGVRIPRQTPRRAKHRSRHFAQPLIAEQPLFRRYSGGIGPIEFISGGFVYLCTILRAHFVLVLFGFIVAFIPCHWVTCYGPSSTV